VLDFVKLSQARTAENATFSNHRLSLTSERVKKNHELCSQFSIFLEDLVNVGSAVLEILRLKKEKNEDWRNTGISGALIAAVCLRQTVFD